jgi:hypothetical protein
MYNIVEEHFSIIIAPVRSRGGSLVLSIKPNRTDLVVGTDFVAVFFNR